MVIIRQNIMTVWELKKLLEHYNNDDIVMGFDGFMYYDLQLISSDSDNDVIISLVEV